MKLNFASALYRITDHPIRIITNKLIPFGQISARLEAEKKHIFYEKSMSDYLLVMISTIHERSSTMVGHLSIMFALTIFLIDQSDNSPLQFFS